MVKNVGELPDKNEIRLLEKKLDRCRNPENNPDSEEYRNKMNELLNEDEDAPGPIEYHSSADQNDISMTNMQFSS